MGVPKVRLAKPRKGPKPEALMHNASSLPMYLKCLADPFSMPACQMPDMYGGKTVAFKLVDEYTVATDASGAACWAASPTLSQANGSYTVTAGVTSNVTWAAHPDNATVVAGYTWSRLVCFGVEVAYIGATQSAAGWLTYVEDHAKAYLSSVSLASVGDDGVSGRADAGRVATMFPVHEPRFGFANDTAADVPTFPCAYFVAQGLPASTPVFRVRVTRHIEGLPLRTNLMRDAATHSHASPSTMAAAANMGVAPRSSVNEPSARQGVVKALESAAIYAITHPYETFNALEKAGAMVSTLLM
jgi:hypothetical protein